MRLGAGSSQAEDQILALLHGCHSHVQPFRLHSEEQGGHRGNEAVCEEISLESLTPSPHFLEALILGGFQGRVRKKPPALSGVSGSLACPARVHCCSELGFCSLLFWPLI